MNAEKRRSREPMDAEEFFTAVLIVLFIIAAVGAVAFWAYLIDAPAGGAR